MKAILLFIVEHVNESVETPVANESERNQGKPTTPLTGNKKISMKQTDLSYMYSSKIFTCTRCQQHIVGNQKYKDHTETCSTYKCVYCKKNFLSDENFQRHKRTCPPKRHSCQICQKNYSRKSDMLKHSKRHIPVQKTFVCHWCGCSCLTGRILEIHIEQKHM